MERYLKNFDRCLEREIPFCEAECPFHMEIFNFMEKARRGASKAAFKVYRNAVGYPYIANLLCTEPCKGVCPRDNRGGAIEMKLLEKSATALAVDTSPTDYNIPMKKEKVAIIGAGISGMAALLRLSTKKYHVEVFEKTDRIGGNLWDIMEPDIFLNDFKMQLSHQEYEIHFNFEIESKNMLEKLVEERNFDAVYVATGYEGNDFGLVGEIGELGDKHCRKVNRAGYFAGGGLIGMEPIYALAGGLAIGTVIDNYLKTGYLYYPGIKKKSRMCKGMADIRDDKKSVELKEGVELYTKEEIIEEAGRCIKCQCNYCTRNCDLVEYTQKWPVRMRDEIVATTLEGKSELKATPAKRLMSLCNQCGICKDVCPEDIDLDGLFLVGRKKMHRQGKMPWAFHDFFIKDMEFSNSISCSIVKRGKAKTDYAFFPGCQLGASEPELVKNAYKYLLTIHENMGLMLMCCGVPAEWSGDEQLHNSKLDEIREAWENLERPTLLVACPTCLKQFRIHLPEIPIKSLYEMLDCEVISNKLGMNSDFHIFDACTSKDNSALQGSIRRLARKTGAIVREEITPMPRCCGFGGHGEIADYGYKEFTARKRIEESDLPYITYCINCRDNFREEGKEAYHILELILNEKLEGKSLPTVTKRRHNRIELKRGLLKEFWGEVMDENLIKKPISEIAMNKELTQKLNKERILLEDVAAVIEFCERSKRTIYNEEDGTYTGYKEIGFITIWVTYKIVGDNSYELINTYTHRMKIELEAVWNGRKCEVDL